MGDGESPVTASELRKVGSCDQRKKKNAGFCGKVACSGIKNIQQQPNLSDVCSARMLKKAFAGITIILHLFKSPGKTYVH